MTRWCWKSTAASGNSPALYSTACTVLRGGGRSNAISLPDFVYGRTRSCRTTYANGKLATKRCPMAEWRIVVKDRYPAYIEWESFERIQAMLGDNHAEYNRNRTRGVPRGGAALLQGIVWCGRCGHKMTV